MEDHRCQFRKTVIAGPCALESREQLKACVQFLKQRGVDIIRASLWKPRTQPGWDGFGVKGLSILLEETIPYGAIPATEIISAEHALQVVHALERYNQEAKMLVWLGSRNQNHLEQRKIAKILSTGPEGLLLMFKNQMWEDEKHWIGIGEHLLSEGFPSKRLLICHRGFAPGKHPNPKGCRNLADFEMAMRVKEQTRLPMILDPSHIGGTRENVLDICSIATAYNFDGYLVEMHCDPQNAKTDQSQQLPPAEFDAVLKIIRGPSYKSEVA